MTFVRLVWGISGGRGGAIGNVVVGFVIHGYAARVIF